MEKNCRCCHLSNLTTHLFGGQTKPSVAAISRSDEYLKGIIELRASALIPDEAGMAVISFHLLPQCLPIAPAACKRPIILYGLRA